MSDDSETGEKPNILQEFTERISYVVEPPKPLPEAELKEFIFGLCDGRIFTSAHLREHELEFLQIVFMPLGLGMFRDHTENEMKKIEQELGVMWEWIDKAGPRSINGLPSFFSVRMLCKSDWAKAIKAHKAEMERRKNFTIPT
jgi:hypothetical protein